MRAEHRNGLHVIVRNEVIYDLETIGFRVAYYEKLATFIVPRNQYKDLEPGEEYSFIVPPSVDFQKDPGVRLTAFRLRLDKTKHTDLFNVTIRENPSCFKVDDELTWSKVTCEEFVRQSVKNDDKPPEKHPPADGSAVSLDKFIIGVRNDGDVPVTFHVRCYLNNDKSTPATNTSMLLAPNESHTFNIPLIDEQPYDKVKLSATGPNNKTIYSYDVKDNPSCYRHSFGVIVSSSPPSFYCKSLDENDT